MSETECKYWSFDGGNSQRGICAIDNKFCDCLVGERDCYYKQLKKCEQKLEKIKEILSFCYSEEGTEIPCIDCKYYKECEIQPIDYVIKIIEGAEDE